MKKFILLILAGLLIFLTPKLVGAEGTNFLDSTPSANIKVESAANVIDRLKERIILFLKFSQKDKVKFYNDLIEKRLAELEYIVESGQGDRIEETSSRYSTYLGKYSEFIMSNNIKDKKEELLKMYERHLKVLDRLERNFEFGTGLWRLIEYDIDTVKIFSQKIKNL